MPSFYIQLDWSDTWYNIDPRHRMIRKKNAISNKSLNHKDICMSVSLPHAQCKTQHRICSPKMKLPMKYQWKYTAAQKLTGEYVVRFPWGCPLNLLPKDPSKFWRRETWLKKKKKHNNQWSLEHQHCCAD